MQHGKVRHCKEGIFYFRCLIQQRTKRFPYFYTAFSFAEVKAAILSLRQMPVEGHVQCMHIILFVKNNSR